MENKTKNDLIKTEEENYIKVIDKSGIENAIGKLVLKNNSLLPNNIAVERIKNSAGFYIANREDLMQMDNKSKMQMLYEVLKEAMCGCEAGTDYDIIPFKGKPVVIRKKEGWFKVIDLIKPAEIVRFTNNVVFKGDEFSFNPVTEELKHIPITISDKYDDIEGAYAYIKFSNGFEKTIYMSKKDIDSIKRVSPSANTTFSPWTSMPVKMVKTKVVKEIAKELYVLFGGRINSVVSQAIDSDETSVSQVDSKGYIVNETEIYNKTSNKNSDINLDEIE